MVTLQQVRDARELRKRIKEMGHAGHSPNPRIMRLERKALERELRLEQKFMDEA